MNNLSRLKRFLTDELLTLQLVRKMTTFHGHFASDLPPPNVWKKSRPTLPPRLSENFLPDLNTPYPYSRPEADSRFSLRNVWLFRRPLPVRKLLTSLKHSAPLNKVEIEFLILLAEVWLFISVFPVTYWWAFTSFDPLDNCWFLLFASKVLNVNVILGWDSLTNLSSTPFETTSWHPLCSASNWLLDDKIDTLLPRGSKVWPFLLSPFLLTFGLWKANRWQRVNT